MNDPLLVGVLHSLAHLHEQFEAFTGVKALPITMLGDRDTFNVLHCEVGSALIGRSGIKNASDIRVIHQGKGLTFALEPGDDLLGIHAPLDEFKRDLAANGLHLLGLVNLAHATFTDFLEKAIITNPGRGGPSRRVRFSRVEILRWRLVRGHCAAFSSDGISLR